MIERFRPIIVLFDDVSSFPCSQLVIGKSQLCRCCKLSVMKQLTRAKPLSKLTVILSPFSFPSDIRHKAPSQDTIHYTKLPLCIHHILPYHRLKLRDSNSPKMPADITQPPRAQQMIASPDNTPAAVNSEQPVSLPISRNPKAWLVDRQPEVPPSCTVGC